MKISLTEKICSSLPDGIYSDKKVQGLRYTKKGNKGYFTFRRSAFNHCYNVYIGTCSVADARSKAFKYNGMSSEEFVSQVVPHQFRKITSDSKKRRTFDSVIKLFFEFKVNKKEWTSHRTIDNAYSRIKNHVSPHIGNKMLSEITYADVAKIAEGNWGKGKTIARVINIVKECFNWAIAKGWAKEGFNPADRNGPLKYLIPEMKHTKGGKQNHGAIPLDRVPEFFSTLNQIQHISARCFEFSILTATRSYTVRNARWEDINIKDGIWTIPVEDLKIKENGKLLVPLCPKVVSFLQNLSPKESGFLFPNPIGEPYSDNIFCSLIKRLNKALVRPFIDVEQTERAGKVIRATQHGIARAGFKTWARNDLLGNDTKYEDKVSELCLHHKVQDAYNGAYERNSYWERRSQMMKEWADFVMKPTEPAELKYGQTYTSIQGSQPRERGRFARAEKKGQEN